MNIPTVRVRSTSGHSGKDVVVPSSGDDVVEVHSARVRFVNRCDTFDGISHDTHETNQNNISSRYLHLIIHPIKDKAKNVLKRVWPTFL